MSRRSDEGIEMSTEHAVQPHTNAESQVAEDAARKTAESQAGERAKSVEEPQALERRLQALVDAEQGVHAQLQADAERRVAEARDVLSDARAESEREPERRAELEG